VNVVGLDRTIGINTMLRAMERLAHAMRMWAIQPNRKLPQRGFSDAAARDTFNAAISLAS
jgi:uncharacterized protein (DUF1501 family)